MFIFNFLVSLNGHNHTNGDVALNNGEKVDDRSRECRILLSECALYKTIAATQIHSIYRFELMLGF